MTPEERAAYRPRRGRTAAILIFLLLALAAAFFGFYGWQWSHDQSTAPASVGQQGATGAPMGPQDGEPPVAAAAPETPPVEPPKVADAEPKFPIAPPPSAQKLPPLPDADARVEADVDKIVGRKSAESLLQMDGFVRRMVATVDNLPRQVAPAVRWPVQPTGPKLMTHREGDATVISPDNADRYKPLLRLVESVDAADAAQVYRKLYPLFQEAYRELGFPSGNFNDRLVEVIDHLIAAPEPAAPLAVKLTEVKGEYAAAAAAAPTWTRYEFVDPKLESLSSGQKIMVRMGLANEKRMKEKLAALRTQLIASGAGK